jgi:hypothetical protein
MHILLAFCKLNLFEPKRKQKYDKTVPELKQMPIYTHCMHIYAKYIDIKPTTLQKVT